MRWCNKIFTGTTERSTMNGRDECSAGRWSSLLLTFASRIIPFGTPCDSWPNGYLFQNFCVCWNGVSSLAVLESSPFTPLLYKVSQKSWNIFFPGQRALEPVGLGGRPLASQRAQGQSTRASEASVSLM
jgi:hypothetical protein